MAYSTGGQQLRTLFQYLQSYGFIDFVLPALLIFALIFGVLQRVGLFMTKKKNAQGQEVPVPDRRINGVLALIIGFAVVVPHMVNMYPAKYDPIVLINLLLPNAAVLLIAILAVILLFGIVRTPGSDKFPVLQLLIGIAAAGVLIVKFLMDLFPEFFPGSFNFLRDPAIQAVIIVIGVMAFVIYFAFKPAGGESADKWIERWVEKKPPQRRT
ncbi:MAG: hypothetical protein NTW67_00600 [Candidatus Woesearchaeota archaeon]|nr:hypothetical protein [Candidatus Woesearchaeota archaeon]